MRHLDHAMAVIQAAAEQAKAVETSIEELRKSVETAAKNHVAKCDQLAAACPDCRERKTV